MPFKRFTATLFISPFLASFLRFTWKYGRSLHTSLTIWAKNTLPAVPLAIMSTMDIFEGNISQSSVWTILKREKDFFCFTRELNHGLIRLRGPKSRIFGEKIVGHVFIRFQQSFFSFCRFVYKSYLNYFLIAVSFGEFENRKKHQSLFIKYSSFQLISF